MVTVLTFRPDTFAGDVDLAAIAELINICRAADGLENRTSVVKLQEKFVDPRFDTAHDLKLWRDRTGALVAAASLWRLDAKEVVMGRLE
ncbi:MAG: GNAT family N-acetyltransferase, partial [Cyanobacteria bacterium J06636_16]